MLKRDIGDRLRDARKKHGELNQKQAADFFGVPFSTFKSWELGITFPAPDAVLEMAKYYGSTVGFIYAGEETPQQKIIVGEILELPDDIGALSQREAQRLIKQIGFIKAGDEEAYEDLADEISDLVLFVRRKKEG